MLTMTRGAENAILVVHEIYGINSHMQAFCKQLADHNYDVYCPNLLGDAIVFTAEEEADAYLHFKEKVGFAKAASQITHTIHLLQEKYQRIFVVGFSVGATAAWLCSAEEPACAGVVGYYGSRIRDYPHLNPKCPVLLFFAAEEKSFAVDDLLPVLHRKNGVEVQKFIAKHGFGNPFSDVYSKTLSEQAFQQMMRFFEQIRSQ